MKKKKFSKTTQFIVIFAFFYLSFMILGAIDIFTGDSIDKFATYIRVAIVMLPCCLAIAAAIMWKEIKK